MHVLYIPRDPRSRKRNRNQWRRKLLGYVDGPEGFFEASLHGACKVTCVAYDEAIKLPRESKNRFDAVIVNSRSGLPWLENTDAALRALNEFDVPVSCFNSHDKAETLGNDRLLDRFRVIFKREPFSDLSRYKVSSANADKIIPTHLANPVVSHSTRLHWKNRVQPLSQYAWQVADKHDVFFIGTVNYNRYVNRVAAWRAIASSEVSHVGGLLPKADFAASVPPEYVTEPLPKADYLDVMMKSRINLAIEGIGPFTFRHLEQFWIGAFTLSTASVRDIRLRTPLVEDRDYVAFDNPDDMMDKIRWYLDHDDERTAIARNGRAAYEQLYDTVAHGREIRAALEA